MYGLIWATAWVLVPTSEIAGAAAAARMFHQCPSKRYPGVGGAGLCHVYGRVSAVVRCRIAETSWLGHIAAATCGKAGAELPVFARKHMRGHFPLRLAVGCSGEQMQRGTAKRLTTASALLFVFPSSPSTHDRQSISSALLLTPRVSMRCMYDRVGSATAVPRQAMMTTRHRH